MRVLAYHNRNVVKALLDLFPDIPLEKSRFALTGSCDREGGGRREEGGGRKLLFLFLFYFCLLFLLILSFSFTVSVSNFVQKK